jgi:O-acetyl-ADP-ribose deacetylase (regulator of RNase III)
VIERSSEYRINQSTFRVAYCDITTLGVDAIVSSDDTYLSMGGGVSLAIADKAGDMLRAEARKHVPLSVGDVVATSAGDLKARYVFHAATLDYQSMVMPDEEIIGTATARCMKLADALAVRSVAFPALGTGVGRFPFQLAADVMMNKIAEHLRGDTGIESVVVALWARPGVEDSDLNLFYERSVGIAAVIAQSRSLSALVGDLKQAISRLDRPELVATVTRLEAQLEGARREVLSQEVAGLETGVAVPTTEALFETGSYRSMERAGLKAVALSETASDQFAAWSDRQVTLEILRTRMAGLSQIINVSTVNLNRLEVERAKHGGVMVPPRLENAIDDLEAEIEGNKARFASAQEELARVVAN